MTIQQRMKSPTPKFFKEVRKLGLIAATIGTALISSPVTMPELILKTGEYLIVAGGVASAVSQLSTGGSKKKKKANGAGAE